MKTLLAFLLLIPPAMYAQKAPAGKGHVVSADTARSVVQDTAHTILLQEVVVTAQLPEVELRGDTTVINAEAFKTAEGAYLEELVRRIPGLEYDRQSHAITYNGLPISEINVNGESFFGGNMQMALENLPAKLVNKIKVYDKRSELEKITHVRKGGENYVLDLQTKREFNGTLMASAEVAGGNNRKRDAQLIGNIFREGGENYSVIARTGNKSMDTRYDGNRQDNVSVNFSKNIRKGLTVFGNAMYNRNVNGNETASYNEQYLLSGNRYQYAAANSVNRNRMGNAMMGLRWRMDEKTFLNLTANGTLSHGDNSSENHNASFTASTGMNTRAPFEGDIYNNVEDSLRVNDIRMQSLSKLHNTNYSVNADLTRALNERGTSISLTAQLSGGTAKSDAFSLSSTTYYQLQDAFGNDSLLYRHQYNHSPSSNHSASLGLMFTQPIGKAFLQFGYKFSRSRQQSDRQSYDLASLETYTDDGGVDFLPDNYLQAYTDSLSNHSLSRTTAHELSLNMSYNDKTWEINGGLIFQPERRTLEQNVLSEERRVKSEEFNSSSSANQANSSLFTLHSSLPSVNLNPQLTVAWHKGKTRITLNYNGDTQQPSLTDLLTLTDNSDPLNITRGNPDLKAAYNQHIRLEARNTRLGLSGDVNFSNTYNSQTQAVSYNLQTGGRETQPVNINGNWSIRGNVRFSKRFRKVFSVAVRTGANYAESVSLVNEGQSELPERSLTQTTAYNGNVRLGYSPKWGGFDLSADWRYRHSDNRLRQTSTYTRNYSFALNAYAELPIGLQLKSDATYSFRNGTGISGHDDDQWLWNVALSWRFLKQKQAELSLTWTDILSDRKSNYRNVTASGLSESHNQQIGGYFMVAFKWRFNKQL